eukprot:364433-Chlamydomonas_euryale.AAC.6
MATRRCRWRWACRRRRRCYREAPPTFRPPRPARSPSHSRPQVRCSAAAAAPCSLAVFRWHKAPSPLASLRWHEALRPLAPPRWHEALRFLALLCWPEAPRPLAPVRLPTVAASPHPPRQTAASWSALRGSRRFQLGDAVPAGHKGGGSLCRTHGRWLARQLQSRCARVCDPS